MIVALHSEVFCSIASLYTILCITSPARLAGQQRHAILFARRAG